MNRDDSLSIITTFSAKGLLDYGHRFISTAADYWPSTVRCDLYYDGDPGLALPPGFRIVPLSGNLPELDAFVGRHGGDLSRRGLRGGKYDYRFDAVKFAHKSFVIAHAGLRCASRFMIWLDADTITLKALPEGFFQSLGNGSFVTYLGRHGFHSETGFLLFDLHHSGRDEFFRSFQAMYDTDEVFNLREWHDCEVFDTVRSVLSARKTISAHNLSSGLVTQHPFINTRLGEYFDHLKGPARKIAGSSAANDYVSKSGPPGRPSGNPQSVQTPTAGRYRLIPFLIDAVQPQSIIEVGTWNGHRARQMLSRALLHKDSVNYLGFDLFEAGSTDDDVREKNVKPHFSLEAVNATLVDFCESNSGATFQLVPGDTRKTLKECRADLVFIDGGHSVETIRSDYAGVAGSRYVLFDDYYHGDINIDRFGANLLVSSLDHLEFSERDPVAGGGQVSMVLVASLDDLMAIRKALAERRIETRLATKKVPRKFGLSTAGAPEGGE